MEEKRKGGVSLAMMMMLFLMVLAATFEGKTSQPVSLEKSTKSATPNNGFPSTALFTVVGDISRGYYYAAVVGIGNETKTFNFAFDTGSDLPWVQCDAPCTGCSLNQSKQYKPHDNFLQCSSSLCKAVSKPVRKCNDDREEKCNYKIKYPDQCSSRGELVVDSFSLQLVNGSIVNPDIAFGCGYRQESKLKTPPSPKGGPRAGVLGLGRGESSFISQLLAQTITKNVIGHCLSSQEGGFLFLGDHYVPSAEIAWTPIIPDSKNYYTIGPAELFYDGKPSGKNASQLVVRSGSSYTYFSSQLYETALNMIKKDLIGKPLEDAIVPQNETLSICWEGLKPFKSIDEAKTYFMPLAFNFPKANNVQLQIPPEHYLALSDKAVCLGILNGTKIGLGETNLIGDISLQDNLVIYDNERQRIGWIPADCKYPRPDVL